MDIAKHHLVYPMVKLSDSDKQALLQKYNIDVKALPKILKDDPSITKLGVKVGDIVQVERPSKTAGVSYYYRVVING